MKKIQRAPGPGARSGDDGGLVGRRIDDDTFGWQAKALDSLVHGFDQVHLGIDDVDNARKD